MGYTVSDSGFGLDGDESKIHITIVFVAVGGSHSLIGLAGLQTLHKSQVVDHPLHELLHHCNGISMGPSGCMCVSPSTTPVKSSKRPVLELLLCDNMKPFSRS